MTALGWIFIILATGSILLPFWYRWLDYREEMLRQHSHLEELRYCYGSEQSFLDIEDDPEHLESITPQQIFHQHGPAHHPGEFIHTTTRMPSMTEEEQENIQAELAQEETENCCADIDDAEIDTWNDDGGQT